MLKWLLLIPVVIFLGMGWMFYVGMQRVAPNDMPSAFLDKPAPGVGVLGGGGRLATHVGPP